MDGVQLAILNKRFEAICRKMANTLFRTGRSGVLNTARDFLLLHRHRRLQPAGDRREPADPRAERP